MKYQFEGEFKSLEEQISTYFPLFSFYFRNLKTKFFFNPLKFELSENSFASRYS